MFEFENAQAVYQLRRDERVLQQVNEQYGIMKK
jgi:hypothetical protein